MFLESRARVLFSIQTMHMAVEWGDSPNTSWETSNAPTYCNCCDAACVSKAFADVTYDDQDNVVKIATPSEGSDFGQILIRSAEHVELIALALRSGRVVHFCGIEPSLGLVQVDGQVSADVYAPSVTESLPFTSPFALMQGLNELG